MWKKRNNVTESKEKAEQATKPERKDEKETSGFGVLGFRQRKDQRNDSAKSRTESQRSAPSPDSGNSPRTHSQWDLRPRGSAPTRWHNPELSAPSPPCWVSESQPESYCSCSGFNKKNTHPKATKTVVLFTWSSCKQPTDRNRDVQDVFTERREKDAGKYQHFTQTNKTLSLLLY